MLFELRVSRRANADPLIKELNVGDAAEPQGRGTGRPSLNCSFVVFLWFWRKTTVELMYEAMKMFCSEQVVPWPTLMEMDDWTCCWHTERAPSSLSPSSRSPRCVFVCVCSILKSCLFKEVRNYKLNLHTFSGGCQQLAAGYPSHTVRILRPGSQGHCFYQSERRSYAHHRQRLRVPVWDGASRTFWFRYGWRHKPFCVTLVKLESLRNLKRQTKQFFPWPSGNDEATVLEVFWPDGRFYTRTLQPGEMNSVVEVTYPRGGDMAALPNDTQVGP